MKRRKILVVIPALGLLLTGCSFQEGFASAKHWVGQNIYHPVKDFVEGLIGKKDSKEEEQKPSEDGGKQDSGDQTEVKFTVKFEAGGGSGTMADVTDVKGEYVLPACTFTAPEGKEFAGWKVGDEVKAVGEKITVSADVTLVATWKDAGGGGETDVSSIADVYAAALALEEGAVSSESYKFEGTVIGKRGTEYFVQEGEYGIDVYGAQTEETIVAGDKVEVVSTVQNYYQIPETKAISSFKLKEHGSLPESYSVTSADALAAAKFNVLVGVVGTAKADVTVDTTKDLSLTIDVGGSDVVVFVKKSVISSFATELSKAKTGYTIAVSNATVGMYKGTRQVLVTEFSSITVSEVTVAPEEVTITNATQMVAGGQLSLSATVGPQGASQDVSWEIVSEGTTAEGAAIANGVLTAPNAGTVIVKATATGTEVSSTVSITVTAPDKQLVTSIVADPESITMDDDDEPVQITATVSPSNVEEEVTWTVPEGSDVIELSNDHKVSPKKAGTAKVRIEGAESKVGVTVNVTVNSTQAEEGTADNPYTVAAARQAATATAAADKYVSGIIYKVDQYLSSYHSITYWISDTGEGNSSNKDGIKVYSGKNIGGANFSSVDDLLVGDEVVVKGSLMIYNSDTYELDKNNEIVTRTSPTVTSLSISGSAQTAYSAGSNYNASGLTVTAELSNGVHADVTSKVTWTFNGEETLAATTDDHTVRITASYGGASKYVDVSVEVTAPATDVTPITLDFATASYTTFDTGSVDQGIKYSYDKNGGSSAPVFTKASGEAQYSLKLYAKNYLCIEIDSSAAATYDSFEKIQIWATSKNGTTAGAGEYYKDNMDGTALYTHELTTKDFTAGNEVSMSSASKIYIKCSVGQYRVGKIVLTLKNK